ncbi:hypothetical protein HU200_002434 [Digitaria exilis]|uniref:Uncharacterized protein n=1 Tax=Digitaria exilis TaxID=1010633 RepID=A0A835FVM5_9POAL|nr:hypothetical protein HU200_002434 [Digitaria exilis]
MKTIFDNALATGKYAKGGTEPLATNFFVDLEKGDAADEEGDAREAAAISGNVGEATMSSDIGGQSSCSKPPPKKTRMGADDDLGYMLLSGLEKLSDAIVQTAPVLTEIPDDLHDNLMSVPGFEEAHLVHYYAHLCDNPSIARVFNGLSLSNKMIWIARYIKTHISSFC